MSDWPGSDDEPGYCVEHGVVYPYGGECRDCDSKPDEEDDRLTFIGAL